MVEERRSGSLAMVLRVWHGRTRRKVADAYGRFLLERAIPDYRSVAGNLDVKVVRRDEGEVSHFLTITLWTSEDAIRAFAGDDLLRAKYYPEDSGFLLELEPEVQHFTVLGDGPTTVDPVVRR